MTAMRLSVLLLPSLLSLFCRLRDELMIFCTTRLPVRSSKSKSSAAYRFLDAGSGVTCVGVGVGVISLE